MMTVYLNGQPLSVPDTASLHDILLIAQQQSIITTVSGNLVSVVNQSIVPASLRATCRCHANDQLELFTAVAGG